MRKEHIALHITTFVQQNLHNNNFLKFMTTILEVFAAVAKVNVEALNKKSCKPQQKHCQGKAKAKCIFKWLPHYFICRNKEC